MGASPLQQLAKTWALLFCRDSSQMRCTYFRGISGLHLEQDVASQPSDEGGKRYPWGQDVSLHKDPAESDTFAAIDSNCPWDQIALQVHATSPSSKADWTPSGEGVYCSWTSSNGREKTEDGLDPALGRSRRHVVSPPRTVFAPIVFPPACLSEAILCHH